MTKTGITSLPVPVNGSAKTPDMVAARLANAQQKSKALKASLKPGQRLRWEGWEDEIISDFTELYPNLAIEARCIKIAQEVLVHRGAASVVTHYYDEKKKTAKIKEIEDKKAKGDNPAPINPPAPTAPIKAERAVSKGIINIDAYDMPGDGDEDRLPIRPSLSQMPDTSLEVIDNAIAQTRWMQDMAQDMLQRSAENLKELEKLRQVILQDRARCFTCVIKTNLMPRK